MGLIDVLNGMQNGPRGARGAPSESSSGGMSPITMAILGLLAYKAVKHFTNQPAGAGASPGAPLPAPEPEAGSAGGLGDLLKNVLGGGDIKPVAGFPGHYASYDLEQHDEVSHITIEKMDSVHQQLLAKIMQLSATPAKTDDEVAPLRYVVPPKQLGVVATRILSAAIGVMDETVWRRPARGQRHGERCDG